MTAPDLSKWTDPPDPDAVLVFEVEMPDAYSTIAIGHGLRESDGTMVRFAGDWRELLTVAAAIRDSGHPVSTSFPSWAVLGVSRGPAA